MLPMSSTPGDAFAIPSPPVSAQLKPAPRISQPSVSACRLSSQQTIFSSAVWMRHGFGVVARLKLGVSQQQAQARLQSIGQRIAREHPKTSKGFGLTVTGLQQDLAGNLRPALLVLLGAVTFVLLIACVNVANLLLSRAATRRREIAIRAALGAGRWRIGRETLGESLKLSLAGGAA